MFALGHRATLLLDFIEWAVDVFACRGTVSFDARFAMSTHGFRRATRVIRYSGIPCVFFVTNVNLDRRKKMVLMQCMQHTISGGL